MGEGIYSPTGASIRLDVSRSDCSSGRWRQVGEFGIGPSGRESVHSPHVNLHRDALPSQEGRLRSCPVQVDSFDGVWSEMEQVLAHLPGVQGKASFLLH